MTTEKDVCEKCIKKDKQIKNFNDAFREAMNALYEHLSDDNKKVVKDIEYDIALEKENKNLKEENKKLIESNKQADKKLGKLGYYYNCDTGEYES